VAGVHDVPRETEPVSVTEVVFDDPVESRVTRFRDGYRISASLDREIFGIRP